MTILALEVYFPFVYDRRANVKNTTVSGYVNKNNQINIGFSGEFGTDHMQKFYLMKCLNCNYRYKSNGSDIWQRKCPKCQGGKP